MTTDHTEPDYEGTLLARLLAAPPPSSAPGPLVMPPDELAALRKAAAALGLELRPAASPVPSAAPEPVTEAMVDAALAAVARYWKEAHAVLQAYPSRDLARVMLEGAAREKHERSDEGAGNG